MLREWRSFGLLSQIFRQRSFSGSGLDFKGKASDGHLQPFSLAETYAIIKLLVLPVSLGKDYWSDILVGCLAAVKATRSKRNST